MHEQIRQGIKDQVVEVVPTWSLPDLARQVYSTYVANGEPGWSLQTCAGSLSLPISCERLDVEAHLLYLGLKLCLDCIRSALCASLLPCKGEKQLRVRFCHTDWPESSNCAKMAGSSQKPNPLFG